MYGMTTPWTPWLTHGVTRCHLDTHGEWFEKLMYSQSTSDQNKSLVKEIQRCHMLHTNTNLENIFFKKILSLN